jgi:hypothetical protein
MQFPEMRQASGINRTRCILIVTRFARNTSTGSGCIAVIAREFWQAGQRMLLYVAQEFRLLLSSVSIPILLYKFLVRWII